MARDHINLTATGCTRQAQARLQALGQAFKRLGPAASTAESVVGQLSRSATLAQRRSLYRARIAGIRYRVVALRQQDDQDARMDLRADHRKADRYLERCILVLLWLAMFAGVAAIAARPIGGAA